MPLKERRAVKSGGSPSHSSKDSEGSDRHKGLAADAEVPPAFAFRFVIGSVVEDLGGGRGSVGGAALDVVARDVGDAGDF
jgi:hypothetical protein